MCEGLSTTLHPPPGTCVHPPASTKPPGLLQSHLRGKTLPKAGEGHHYSPCQSTLTLRSCFSLRARAACGCDSTGHWDVNLTLIQLLVSVFVVKHHRHAGAAVRRVRAECGSPVVVSQLLWLCAGWSCGSVSTSLCRFGPYLLPQFGLCLDIP